MVRYNLQFHIFPFLQALGVNKLELVYEAYSIIFIIAKRFKIHKNIADISFTMREGDGQDVTLIIDQR